VGDFAARYLADCAGRWKAATLERHAQDVARWIDPGLGSARIADFTRQQVTAWRAALPGCQSARNRGPVAASVQLLRRPGVFSP
jgi:hypothetical protein